MSQVRRLVVPAGTYFFTVRLQDRQARLLTAHVDILRRAVGLCRQRWPFEIETAVILPDHLHMIWTLPAGDGDFSKRWRLIKSQFSRQMDAPDAVRPSLRRRGEKGIWQRRFWDHLIRDDADFEAHRAYALTAPVRAGLVGQPQDWVLSSVHRDLRLGRPLPAAGGYGPVSVQKPAWVETHVTAVRDSVTWVSTHAAGGLTPKRDGSRPILPGGAMPTA